MPLSDDQFERLVLKILEPKHQQSHHNFDKTIIDSLQKIAVALTAAGVIWLVGGVNEMQKDISVIKVNQAQNKSDISEFQEFTKKPRFSFDDFRSQVLPIIQRLEQNEYKLRERTGWMDYTSKKVSMLEGKYEIILEKLSGINKDISHISQSLKPKGE